MSVVGSYIPSEIENKITNLGNDFPPDSKIKFSSSSWMNY